MPPSAMIGTRALARCWVEPMRPVAPLTMMPIVWVATVRVRREAGLCYAGRARVHVGGEQRAPPHRLPDLRFRHPVGLHRPRHDEPDPALTRGVRAARGAAHPG